MVLNEAVIISAARTPVGKFLGSLKGFSATDLGAIAVRESVKRAGVKPEEVDEVIMGCVIQAGLGQNPARQAALNGGLPPSVSAVTVNKVCGSGMKAVIAGAKVFPRVDLMVCPPATLIALPDRRALWLQSGARKFWEPGA